MTTLDDGTVLAKLKQLSDTQASIQTLSQCRHSAQTVRVWKRYFDGVDTKRRLCLLYLANDVLQTGRRRGEEFRRGFEEVLVEAVPTFVADADADELYRGKISRLLTIWQERQVFDEAFVNALRTAAGLKAVNGNGNDVAAVQTPAGESKVATSSPSPRSREKEASSTVAISLPPLYNEIAEQLLRINRASIEVNQLLEQCEQAAPGNEASLVQTVDRAFRRLIADRRTMLDQLAQLQHTQQLLLDADHAFHQQFREQHNDSATFTDSEEGTKHAAIVKRAATTSSSPGKKKAKADTTVVDPRQSSPIPLLSQSAADPMADDAVSNALLADMFLADLGRQP